MGILNYREVNVEPDIFEGYCQVKWYDYSASFTDVLKVALDWMLSHPEYDVEDIFVGADEGTWITLYCRKKEEVKSKCLKEEGRKSIPLTV